MKFWAGFKALFVFLFFCFFLNQNFHTMWSCYLQSLLLQIGAAMLEEENQEAAKEKSKYMKEYCPTISSTGSMQELQVNILLWFTFKK